MARRPENPRASFSGRRGLLGEDARRAEQQLEPLTPMCVSGDLERHMLAAIDWFLDIEPRPTTSLRDLASRRQAMGDDR